MVKFFFALGWLFIFYVSSPIAQPEEFVYAASARDEQKQIASCFCFSSDDQYLAVSTRGPGGPIIKIWKRAEKDWKPAVDFLLPNTEQPCAVCFVGQEVIALSSLRDTKLSENNVQFDLFRCHLKTHRVHKLADLGKEDFEVVGASQLAIAPAQNQIACVTNQLHIISLMDGSIVFQQDLQAGPVEFISDTQVTCVDVTLIALNHFDIQRKRKISTEELELPGWSISRSGNMKAALGRSGSVVKITGGDEQIPDLEVERACSLAITRFKGRVLLAIGHIGKPAELYELIAGKWKLRKKLTKSLHVAQEVTFSSSGDVLAVLEITAWWGYLDGVSDSRLTLYPCSELLPDKEK